MKVVPKIRFEEFKDDWKHSKLADLAKFSKGKGLSKSDLTPDGITECIRYGELYTVYGETIDTVVSRTNVDTSDLVLSEANDVIIPASGETEIDIATASCVLRSGIALGGDLNIIKINQNGVFFSYYLNSKKKRDIASLAQGISVVHLYANQLSLLGLNLPSLPEQQKIASFLSAVDEKIRQLTRKKELLKQYKKGVMQQLYSSKLRFKDENGKAYPKWEKKRLGEISEKVTEKNKGSKLNFVLTNSATQGIVSQSDYFDREIANQNNLDGYFIVGVDDFVYNPRVSVNAPVGPIKRNKLIKGVMSPLYLVFRFDNSNLEYLEHFFGTTLWHDYLESVANIGARHDRMNIANSDFFNMPIPIPSLVEQQKIASFLTALDAKIESVATQITHTQTFKKGLLQQMFV